MDNYERTSDEIFFNSAPSPLPKSDVLYFIEVGSQCNLACPLCGFGNIKNFLHKNGQMDLELFVKIIDKIKSLRRPAIISPYHHCEPLIYPILPKIIKIIKEFGFRSSISSNFNKIDILEESINSGLDEIIISVSGFYQSTYSKGHCNGDIEIVKNNMRKLAELIKKLESSINVVINYHMYLDNLGDDYLKMKEFSQELNFIFQPSWARPINTELGLKYLRDISGEVDPSNWLDQNIRLGADFLQAMDRVAYLPQNYQKVTWRNLRSNCPLSGRIVNIKWNGAVNLCSCSFDDRLTVGNFLEFDLDNMEKIRKDHPLCKECMEKKFDLYSSYFDMPAVDRVANANIAPEYRGIRGFT